MSLLGTANTLTVMVTDCDGSMDPEYSEPPMKRLLSQTEAPSGLCKEIDTGLEERRCGRFLSDQIDKGKQQIFI